MGKHWSREIMEGATFPPTLETEKQFEESKDINWNLWYLFKSFRKKFSAQ